MRIIAKTNGGYLIEAKNNEVANLLGFYFASNESRAEDMQIGAEINIHAMFMQLYALNQQRGKLAEVQKELRATADALTPIIPLIPQTATAG